MIRADSIPSIDEMRRSLSFGQICMQAEERERKKKNGMYEWYIAVNIKPEQKMEKTKQETPPNIINYLQDETTPHIERKMKGRMKSTPCPLPSYVKSS